MRSRVQLTIVIRMQTLCSRVHNEHKTMLMTDLKLCAADANYDMRSRVQFTFVIERNLCAAESKHTFVIKCNLCS
jgi:hypothetical protein